MKAKMKILFLANSSSCFDSFIELSKVLIKRGHECKFIAPDDCEFRVNFEKADWNLFDFKALEEFNPDKVVIFSGKFGSVHAASEIIRKRYKTYFCELGWLPQAFNKYIDTDIQHMGSIAKYVNMVKYNEVTDKKTLFKIRELYRAGSRKLFPNTGKLNILVPLQLENDTSIIYGSPLFKTMDSLIGHVSSELPECRIIVKEHPRNQAVKRKSYHNVVYYRSGNINDMIASCDAVVGINSTCLIEARVHHKPVYQFGSNVIQIERNKETLREFIDNRNFVNEDNGLVALFNAQFDQRRPSESVIHLMEN